LIPQFSKELKQTLLAKNKHNPDRPILMGGFANNTTGVSGKKAYDFYEELNSRLPDDFEMKHTAERLLL